MKLENYKQRIIDEKISFYLTTFSSILIEGPKWCGKTWTSKNNSNSEIMLSDPKGNFNNKKLALMNPYLILDGDFPRLIDEWQEAPLIWDAVRGKVDSDPRKGQFILTGSATINKNKYIHTGTGRIARLKMRPMSLYESGKSKGEISLHDICYGKAKDVYLYEVDINDIIDCIVVGGWPATLELDVKRGMLVSKEYVKSVINEDIFKVDNIKRDKHKIELLLKSLARNECTTVTNTTLKRDIIEKDSHDIDVDTITDYLNLFNNLYILENIPPFSSNIRSSIRVKQSEKRHFVDPSLPCALLNLSHEKLLNNLDLLGFMFESLVQRDLLTYVESFGGKVFHYQDYENNEIDSVIELEDGSWCAFEIKLGANQIDDAALKLIALNKNIEKKGGKPARQLCVICGLTNAAYRRNDGVYVVPITSLKN